MRDKAMRITLLVIIGIRKFARDPASRSGVEPGSDRYVNTISPGTAVNHLRAVKLNASQQ